MVDSFSQQLHFTFVGNFSHGRPTKVDPRSTFAKLGLKGQFSLGHLDSKHMQIKLIHEGEFNRIWMRQLWYIGSFPIRVFKWSLEFFPEVESLIVPVWVSLPNLPLFMFNKQCLFSIENIIGKHMTCDLREAKISRPSVPRLCIQVNLLKKIPSKIWMECGDQPGFWQQVKVEKHPKYCKNCKRLGHDVNGHRLLEPQEQRDA